MTMPIPELTRSEQRDMRRFLTILNRIAAGKSEALTLHMAGAVEGMLLACHRARGLGPLEWLATINTIQILAAKTAGGIMAMPENQRAMAILAAQNRPAAGSC